MYSLEDRIYFDGAAAATLADNNNNTSTNAENTDTSSNTDNSNTNTNSSNNNSTPDSGTAKDTSSAPTKDTSSTTATKDTSAATNSDSSANSAKIDIDALIASILNTDTAASSNTPNPTLVVSTAVENASEIAKEAQEHNITVVTYDPAKETLQQLFKDIQDSLKGEKATSINFVTADNSAAGVSLISASAISAENISINSDVSTFVKETASLLTDDGRISVSGDSSLESSDATALETAIANAAGVKVSFIDDTNGKITTAAPDAINYNIIFVDSSVTDTTDLLKNLSPNTEVYYISGTSNGVEQITKDLEGKTNVDSIQIIAHGNSSDLLLGSTALNKDNVSTYSEQIAQWGNSLTSNGDILIYSCNTAETDIGKELVNNLASLTGHDVAASTDITGGSSGNWTLEYSTGVIDATAAFDASNYHYQLTGLNVTSSADNGTDGTLRYAVNYASTFGGEIYFDSSLSGSTITLSSSISISSGSVTINESLNNLSSALTISSSSSSIFAVSNSKTLTIIGGSSSNLLTLTTGGTAYSAITVASGASLTATHVTFNNCGSNSLTAGGAINSLGTVTLNNDTFSNCHALSGGAVYSTGTLNAENCTFSDNGCTASSGDVYGGAIYGNTITLDSCLFSGNSISTTSSGNAYGGAIYISNLTAINCTFYDNSVTATSGNAYGGAIYIESGTVYSCTIAYNSASGIGSYGGGLAVFFNSSIGNTIVVSNTAPTSGADIYVDSSDGSLSDDGYNVVKDFYSENSLSSSTNILYNSTTSTWQKDGVDLSSQTLDLNSALSYTGGFTKTLTITGSGFLSSSEGAGDSGVGTDGRGYYRVNSVNGGTTVYASRGAWQYNGAVAYIGSEYFTTIQNACNSIADGGTATIILAGTAICESGIEVTSGSMTKITIQGQGSSETYVQAAESAGISTNSIFTFNGCELTINDLTIRYGGSGIYSASAWAFTMNRVNVCYNSSGSVAVTMGNDAGDAYLNDCTISNNDACGISSYSSYLYLTNCTISNNSSSSDGGGVYFSFDGTCPENPSATMTNCTFLYNHSGGNGGAISISTNGADSLTLDSCTIAYNYTDNSSSQGGGVYVANLFAYAYVKNTIMTDNYRGTVATPNDFYFSTPQAGSLSDQGYNVVKYSSGASFTQGTDILYNSGTSKWYFYGGSDLANQTLGLATSLTYTGGYTNTLSLSSSSFLLGDSNTAGATASTTDGRGYYRVSSVDGGTTVYTSRGAWQDNGAVAYLLSNSSYYTTIQKAYDAAADGESIELANTAIWESGITFSSGKSITLEASLNESLERGLTNVQAAASSSAAVSRVFNISGSDNITFSTMNIRYGADFSGDGGGAIYFTSSGTLTLNSVTLSCNSSTGSGGAIYFASSGTLTLNSVTFSCNSSIDSGGALYADSSSTVNITDSKFYYNNTYSSTGGGAIYSAGTLSISGTTYFTGNTAVLGEGGAIYNTGTLTLAGTIYANGNTASSTSFIYSNSSLTLNAAAISTTCLTGQTIDVTGSLTVSSNSSLSGYSGGRLTLENVSGSSLSVSFSGGAALTLNAYSTLTFSGDTTISSMTSSESVTGAASTANFTFTTAGTIYAKGTFGTITINNSSALVILSGTTTPQSLALTLGTLALNSNVLNLSSAGASITGSSSSISTSVISGGANASSTGTGRIVVSSGTSGSPATISYVTIKNCTNTAVSLSSGYLTLTGSTFKSNSGTNGGALSVSSGGTLNFSGTVTFDGNTATNGSAIYTASGGTMNLSSSSTNITGTSSANADIYLAASDSVFSVQTDISLAYCTITCNGKIYITSGKTLTMSTASKFESGSGTIYGASESTVLPGNLTFASDSASDSYIPGGYINTLLINSSGTKTAAGNINISNGLTINSGITFAVGTYTATIAGASDINGTLTISTGTFDANGAFDATGGTVTFSGAGNLKLASTVTSLGNFTVSTSTVIYDGGDQTVLAGSYYTLSFYGSTSGSTKTFANGTTKVATEISLCSGTITLTGSSSDAVTVQVTDPGSTHSRVFYILDPGKTITIKNMTIKGGDVSSLSTSGGGIYLHAGTLYLDSVVITGSKANNGGGISSLGTLLTMENCTVSSCTATNVGGGVYSASSLTMENCTIDSCTADSDAGGIYLSASSTLKNCTISNNTASYGAAISMNNCSMVMFNCTISNNSGSSGAIYAVDTSDLTITDSTIAGNKSFYGIYIENWNNDTLLYLTNSIVAYNYYYNSDSDYAYCDIYSPYGGGTIYGNYNITSFTDWTTAGTGNVEYTYTNGKGASLFASYTEISANKIYAPVLADNGGSTYTVALASNSIAAGTGCLTGTYNSGSQYAFSPDSGTTWYKVEDGSTTVTGVTQITTDQRGVSISGTPSKGSYYIALSYYYRSNVDGSGNWSLETNWEVSTDQATWATASVAPTASNSVSITIRAGDTMTVNSSISIDQTTIEATGAIVVANGVTLTVADGTGTDLTANGTLTVNGTGVLLVASGASADVNSTFTVNGTLSFDDSSGSDNGTLNVSNSSITITTLTAGSGTITYDGAAQNIVSATYYNLTLSGSETKTAGGTINAGNNLTVASGVTLALGTYTTTVTGTSDINGTLTISTGTFDANGAFDATGGNVTFTGAGNLKLASTVTSLGTFTASTSTVTYDGGNQTVLAGSYYALSFSGSTSGSTKTFANGTTKVATEISLADTITLTGSSSDAVTVQVTTPGSGGTVSRVFYISASGKTVTIENMTIKGGDVSSLSDYGGGIYVQTGTLYLDSVVITGSKAYKGGGICSFGALTMENCTVSSCTATSAGGGIYVEDSDGGSSLTMENCTVSSCTATFSGGGLFLTWTQLTIKNCTVSSCSASGGGGFYVGGSPGTIENCTVDSCSATSSDGGGFNIDNTSLTLKNCTINNNSCSGYGAAIFYGTDSMAAIVNCTVSKNSSSSSFGAIYIDSNSLITITDSTIAGNAADTGIMIYASSAAYITNSIIAYNYDSSYNYCDIVNLSEVYGNYNITSFTGWTSAGTGNVAYTYTNGKGASLFASYTEISANRIYAPVLADNGGSTYTVALASDSIASGTGCLTGTYNSGSQYAFSPDNGTTWYKVEDGSTTVTGVTQITTDQRGVSISGTPCKGSYYLVPSYYYRSNVDGSGNWSLETNWEVSNDQATWATASVAPTASNSISITIRAGDTMTVNSSISIDQTTIEATGAIVVANGVTLTVADGTGTDLTANGTLTVNGTGVLLVASGASADVNSTFTVNGTLSFDDSSGSDNGTLNVSNSSITITTLTAGSGSITYDGAAQNIVSATYYNLTLSGSGSKTAVGTINAGNNLTVASGVTLALGTYTATVTGTSDINGTLTISTGTFDANGTFDATGGAVTFTGAGNLKLASTVTSLGTFTASTSTVTYDGGNQTVLAASYYTLSFNGSTSGSTKTFANGTTSVATQISLTDAITLTGSSKDNVTVQVTTPGSSNCRVFNVDASGKTVDIKNMTIKGGKVTVGSGGAMVINNGTVNLDGVTVSGSSAQSGGAGYVAASATLNVIDSTIDSNATIIQDGVDCYGGAFYNMGTLNIQNSTLSNNTAKLGGAIFNASAGGVGIVSISLSSQIINNSSTGSGGAIYNEKTLTIDSSTLSGNTAGTDGGAIISWNDTTISNSTINNNTASAGNGGFIYFGDGALTISGSNTFTDNTASANGGAIYISGDTATLTGATFGASGDTTYASANTADKGGAIYIQSGHAIGISNTSFYYNYATNDGGAVYNAGTINFAAASTANSVSFTGNKTTDPNGNGGGAIYNSGIVNIGVSGDTKTVTLTFTANTTVSDNGGGGAIYNSGTITMAAAYTGSSILFTKNEASDGFGGALCISGGTVNLSNATFGKSGDTTYENTAFSGGAVYISGGTFTLTTTLGSNYFYSNSAGYSGGAVYISGGTFTTAGVTFDQNKAPEGGAVAVTGGTFTVTGSDTITFSGNEATSYDGGAIELTDTASSTMNYSSFTGSLLFTGNTAIDDGGAIYVSHGSVTIKNATFGVNGDTTYASANTADYGGAVCISGGTITCDGNVKFYFNEAATYGGAVYLASGSARTITMDSVTYLGNKATGDSGGAVYIEGSNLTVYLTNSTFGAVTDTADIYKYGNKATDGGAVYIYSGTVYLTTDSFLYNYATGNGGAIYVYSSDPSLVVTSNLKFTAAADNTITFTGNSASNGSAIYNNCIIYFGDSGDTKNVTLNITGGTRDFYTTVDASIYVYAPTVISGISGTSAVVTTATSSSFSVYENLTFDYTAVTIRGLINIQSGKTLEISTASTLTGSGELSGSGTLEYTSTSNSDILKGSIGTLNIASSAVETMKGDLEITSSLANTGTLSIDGNTLTLNGSYTDNGGTIIGGATSSLVLGGTENITLPSITDGLGNLTLNRAAATVTISSDLTIYGTLDLSAGYLDIYSHNLTFDTAASVANVSSSSFILESGGGSVIKYFDSSNKSFLFPVGTLSGSTYQYTPITVTFDSAEYGKSTYVGVQVFNSKEAHVSNSSYINRYWTVIADDVTDFSATINAQYLASDVTGTESLLYGEHYASSTWTKLNAVNTATHSFTGTVSHFSNFTAFGQYTPPPTPTPVNNSTTPETNIDQQPQEPQNNMNNNLSPVNDVFLQVQNLMPQTITRSEMTLHSTTWNDLSSRITNNVVPNGEWGIEIFSPFESDDDNPVTLDTHEDSILGATGTDDIIGIAGNYDYTHMSLWASKYEKHPLFKSNVDKLLDSLICA